MVGRKVIILQLGFWALWSSDPMAAAMQRHTCERRVVSAPCHHHSPAITTVMFPQRQRKHPQLQEGNSDSWGPQANHKTLSLPPA